MKKTAKMKQKLLTAILATSMVMACGCGGAGSAQNEESGKSGWKKEMGKVQAAENGQPDADTPSDAVQDPGNDRDDTGSREILVYIREFDGVSMVFDEAEWINIPSDRADELGLEDDGAGFAIYNETKEDLKKCYLADDCVCTVLDWTDNYVPTEVTPEELADLLEERDAPEIPYSLTIADGRIAAVQEHYVP